MLKEQKLLNRYKKSKNKNYESYKRFIRNLHKTMTERRGFELSKNIDTSYLLDRYGYGNDAYYTFTRKPTDKMVYIKMLKLLLRAPGLTREGLVTICSKVKNPKTGNNGLISAMKKAGLIETNGRLYYITDLGSNYLKHFNLI